jgi:hypothetical protein
MVVFWFFVPNPTCTSNETKKFFSLFSLVDSYFSLAFLVLFMYISICNNNIKIFGLGAENMSHDQMQTATLFTIWNSAMCVISKYPLPFHHTYHTKLGK